MTKHSIDDVDVAKLNDIIGAHEKRARSRRTRVRELDCSEVFVRFDDLHLMPYRVALNNDTTFALPQETP